MRLLGWLVLLPVCFFASAACQALSGVDDLEIRSGPAGAGGDIDGSTGSGGALGTGGAVGTGGALGSAGSSGTAGVDGAVGAGGTAASGGSSGIDGGGGTVDGGGTGGSVASGGSGGAPECSVATDCPGEDRECARRTCNNGRCELTPEPEGTVVGQQTAGDCKKNVCDSTGNVVSVNDNTDPKNDGNACTRDMCTSGVPTNPPEPVNTPCGMNTKCDGAGRCVGCTANSDCPADTPCTDWSCNVTSGACTSAHRSTSTPCGPAPACTSGVEHPQDYCDGAGACRDSGSRSCSPLVCGTGACLGSCTADSHCVSGYYCAQGAGTQGGGCQPKKTLGASCSGNSECTNGFCVDGVCCENACTGRCNTCNGVDAGGLPPGYCFPIASGRDPANECAGGRVCNGSNNCTGVIQCDCSTPRYNLYANCCSGCGSQECPTSINTCNAQHGQPCTIIGNVDAYGAGGGVPDQSGQCMTGQRCAVLACTCIQ